MLYSFVANGLYNITIESMLKEIKVGEKFGRLTIVEKLKPENNGRMVLCKCDCGNEKKFRFSRIDSGHSKSCGCLLSDVLLKRNFSHGMAGTKLYNVWNTMRFRCDNVKCECYKNYGGRGIKVCKRWEKFENFYKDMGDCQKGLSLDRIDNSKGYNKANCRWATVEEQVSNKRNNVKLTYRGETRTIPEWSRELNINPGTIRSRLVRLKKIEEVLNQRIHRKVGV